MNGLSRGVMALITDGPNDDGEYELCAENGTPFTSKGRGVEPFKAKHLQRVRNVVLITGEAEVVDPLMAKLSILRKVAPRRVTLPGLSMRDLVNVTLHLVRKRGYRLWRDEGMPGTIGSTHDLMEHIIAQASAPTLSAACAPDARSPPPSL